MTSHQCGEGTHSVTQDGVITCVLNDPVGSYSGLTPSWDFSNPEAIQESMMETLLPNLINLDKLGNVAEASPILFDALVYLTSLAGVIPITAGFVVGMVILFKRMRFNKTHVPQLETTEKKKRSFGFPKFNFGLKKKKDPHGMTDSQKKRYDELEIENAEKQKVSDSIDNVLENIKFPQLPDQLPKDDRPQGGFVLDDIDSVREEVKDPEEMSIDELERQIKEKGHKVELTDGKLEITENPTIEIKKDPEQTLHEITDESSEIMSDELDDALTEDEFNPTIEEQTEASDQFKEQPPPTDDEIKEVQRLISEEGMSQADAIQKVVSIKTEVKSQRVVEFVESEDLSYEETKIKEMQDERDIFKLDLKEKKKTKFKENYEKSKLGMFLNKKKKEKKLAIIEEKKKHVLNDLGHKRMLEYATKIEIKLLHWAREQKLNDKALDDLRRFALFTSMCEFMADRKTSKKKYWTSIDPYQDYLNNKKENNQNVENVETIS